MLIALGQLGGSILVAYYRHQAPQLPVIQTSMMSKTRRSSFEIVCVALHEESNDQAEQSKDGSEDLNRENLDEPGYVSQESNSVY
jgi:hypothetical protein